MQQAILTQKDYHH